MWRSVADSIGEKLRAISDVRLGGALLAGLGLALVALVSFVHLGSEVGEGETTRFEAFVRDGLHAYASPGFTTAMKAVTILGSTPFLIVAGIAAACLLLRAGRHRSVILFSISMAGAWLLNTALKLAYRRERPAAFFDVEVPDSYSFPSGHALLATCFFGTLAALLAARMDRTAHRVAVWADATPVIVAVGVSRVYLGVHYASDVVAGYLAAFVWVTVVAVADRVFRRLAPPYDRHAEQTGTHR
jgi:undecaprenyl-diphosphatase